MGTSCNRRSYSLVLAGLGVGKDLDQATFLTQDLTIWRRKCTRAWQRSPRIPSGLSNSTFADCRGTGGAIGAAGRVGAGKNGRTCDHESRGAHDIAEPAVDWFRFWLQDYEDPHPGKAEHYKCWRELKKMQTENEGKSSTAQPASN